MFQDGCDCITSAAPTISSGRSGREPPCLSPVNQTGEQLASLETTPCCALTTQGLRRSRSSTVRRSNPMQTPSSPTVSNLLTLFPKFFSSFLCSTCSLSVSHRSLALEGVYLPIRAQIPKYPTRRSRSFCRHASRTGLSPSQARLSRRLRPRSNTGHTPSVYNSTAARAVDLKLGLLPLRSPLLRQSLLFSLPPLSDMLKFSGWSCLTSDADRVVNWGDPGCPRARA